eukprot:3919060-Pyramimonas_sp.AAC.1
MMQTWQVKFARIGARVPVIKPLGAHILELDSPWDRNDKRVFPTVHLRLRLSRLTLRYARSCSRHYRFGNYCLTDQCDVYFGR